MEISLKDISEALKLKVNTEYKLYREMFQDWDELSPDDIVLNKVKTANQVLWQQVNNLRQELLSDMASKRKTALHSLGEIINFQKGKLSIVFKTNNLGNLLIFLETHALLRLPLDLYLKELSPKEPEMAAITKNILEYVLRFNFNFQSPDGTPYYEQQLLNEYKNGFKEDDIKKSYQFIEAMEMGRGIQFPHRIKQLIEFLFEIDYPAFIQYTSSLQYPHDYIVVLKWMSTGQLSKLCQDQSNTDKWFLFEAIRQLLKKDPTEKISQIITELVHKIVLIDERFFIQICTYLKRSTEFNQSLGVCLAIKSDLKDTIIENIFQFNKYDFFKEQRNQLLLAFLSKSSDKNKEVLLSTVYKKWEEFMDFLLEDKNFLINSPVLTDHGNYVLAYLEGFCSAEEIASFWKTAFEQIERIEELWFIGKLYRSSHFMVLFAKLYLYTLALKDSDKSLIYSEQLGRLLSNSILQTRYFGDHDNGYSTSATTLASHLIEFLKIEIELRN